MCICVVCAPDPCRGVSKSILSLDEHGGFRTIQYAAFSWEEYDNLARLRLETQKLTGLPDHTRVKTPAEHGKGKERHCKTSMGGARARRPSSRDPGFVITVIKLPATSSRPKDGQVASLGRRPPRVGRGAARGGACVTRSCIQH